MWCFLKYAYRHHQIVWQGSQRKFKKKVPGLLLDCQRNFSRQFYRKPIVDPNLDLYSIYTLQKSQCNYICMVLNTANVMLEITKHLFRTNTHMHVHNKL